jgi:hypothetical protein
MAMRILILSLVVACSSGGTPSAGSAVAPNPKPTPPAPTPDAPVAREMPTPDPITKPLSEDEVRGEATRLARQAFEADPKIVDAAGKHLKTPSYEPTRWTVKRDGARWKLDIDPPGGAYAHVTIGAFAENPKVDVGFATE